MTPPTEPSLDRRRWPQPITAAAIAALLLLVSCGRDSSASIVEIQETTDPLTLDVIIDTCNADVHIDVDESPTTVEFEVQRNDSDSAFNGTDDCQDLVRVTLDKPLGNRQLNEADGTSIPFVAIGEDEP